MGASPFLHLLLSLNQPWLVLLFFRNAAPSFCLPAVIAGIFLLSLSYPNPIKTNLVVVPPFVITITIADNSYTFQVVHIPVSGVIEHFRVSRGSNDWIFQSNRPSLHARGIKHKKPEIKWLSGDHCDRTWRTRIAAALAEVLTQQIS